VSVVKLRGRDVHVVVVYCSTSENGGEVTEDSMGSWETRIGVSISSVQLNVSPVVEPGVFALETCEFPGRCSCMPFDVHKK